MTSKLPKPAKPLKGVAGLFSLTGIFQPVLAHLRIRVDKLADVFFKAHHQLPAFQRKKLTPPA